MFAKVGGPQICSATWKFADLKGLSHEMDLAFDDMGIGYGGYGKFILQIVNWQT